MNYFFRTLSKASIIMMLLLSSCVSVPGTQDWKIKKAAMAYVRQDLKEDERMRWGSILRKGHMEIDGKMCTYAEIKYIGHLIYCFPRIVIPFIRFWVRNFNTYTL